MIFSTLSKQSTPKAFLIQCGEHRTLAALRAPGPTSCRLQIEQVVSEIESPDVREIIDRVFEELLSLLECLGLVQSHLRQGDLADETLALIQIIHDEANLLSKFIRDEGLTCAPMKQELIDTLDGISFAINHELQRVLESQQRTATPQGIVPVDIGELYGAHDLLTNCLQQSTVSLAMAFDSELVGTRLFNNSDRRYRQSLQLGEDLSGLLHLMQACEKDCDEYSFASLSAAIDKFRSESLEFLMYSDWQQFEGFCERIKLTEMSSMELEPLLQQFLCYVETLLGQVRMRSVLAHVFSIPFSGVAA